MGSVDRKCLCWKRRAARQRKLLKTAMLTPCYPACTQTGTTHPSQDLHAATHHRIYMQPPITGFTCSHPSQDLHAATHHRIYTQPPITGFTCSQTSQDLHAATHHKIYMQQPITVFTYNNPSQDLHATIHHRIYMLPSIIRVCYNLEEFVTHTANQSTGQDSQSVNGQSVSQSVTGLLMSGQPHMVI